MAKYSYDAWGNLTEANSAESPRFLDKRYVDNRIRYSGYQYDDNSGLYYVLSRWYDSQNARFISEDTHRGYHPGDALSLNLYTYVRNNPMTKIDPWGYCADCNWWLNDWSRPISCDEYEYRKDAHRAYINDYESVYGIGAWSYVNEQSLKFVNYMAGVNRIGQMLYRDNSMDVLRAPTTGELIRLDLSKSIHRIPDWQHHPNPSAHGLG